MNLSMVVYLLGWILLCEGALLLLPAIVSAIYMESAVWALLGTAALCGLVLAVLCFGKVMLVDRLLMGNASVTVWVDVTVCLTLCVTVLVAKIVGCSLPLIAKRLGFDPAVMASPFITTIVDAMSLLLYFFFAKLLLGV